MPWQLEEKLHVYFAAGNFTKIAEIGLAAMSYEVLTEFDDKADEYRQVWEAAFDALEPIEAVDTRQQG